MGKGKWVLSCEGKRFSWEREAGQKETDLVRGSGEAALVGKWDEDLVRQGRREKRCCLLSSHWGSVVMGVRGT